jgi:hypothetical protein
MLHNLNLRPFCLLLIVFFALLGASCDYNKPSRQADNKDRPLSVPATAMWLGGADGGVYILILKQVGAESDVYYGEVYYQNGELWYKGKLFLTPKVSPVLDYKNPDIYSGWDGDTLYLNDGRVLKALETSQE